MIKKIVVGDIASPENKSDIIIGMNSELGEVSALGRKVLKSDLPPPSLIDLGTVLTFKFDKSRYIHMLICHHLGSGGWRFADQYVRVGMDHLWTTRITNDYSIVHIGTGPIGKRDGANASSILAAIASSYLFVDLFIRDGAEKLVQQPIVRPLKKLEFVSGFSPKSGVLVTA